MNILAIETATEACSAALVTKDETLKEYQVAPQKHSQLILPMVDNLLSQAKLDVAQLHYLAFGRGPGSFTGVRIATGVVQGLAMSASLPVVAVSTLATMAQQAFATHDTHYVASAIDARMGEVYFALYTKDASGVAQLVNEEAVLSPEKACALLEAFVKDKQTSFVSVGTGWESYPQLLSGETAPFQQSSVVQLPDAEYMLPIAKTLAEKGEVLAIDEIQPVYVRDEVTWKKLPGR
ncbi:tRNA (adenosine(37)-N6)-threonylcarbamoyltransferase complex dimerization subunit type 1 TsaB [Alteromonas sp. a30]|uniref:tRNA (adenosine(37)-N6)-threonylcarbamoyltransferase complex dimerization subunit type 1 TsaB n=1 Tax=Alteromonas sp. a30 TaxID=2730917 RepID=UPI002283265D|nr:tRNA (adenosine(37)-N6)-threonylcarbamoyltransferase complex dimerization subunit type 1 TsaB [Alteromonas sp. a30]MCY7296817.1 tRNA (adenosine(37)-N6)-threonylcarbamoyltransferase complex dimerization subunit type 1 TsaB [Alteromonas sp. a30]